jgi:uncharacterized protein DUF3500
VPHYYRVQGPRPLVDHDNARRDDNHAHSSVWRDPKGEFGPYVLGEHHRHGIQRESAGASRVRRLA